MCWCQPSMRTPCCGMTSCHVAALKAGALKVGETCSFCHPPQRAVTPEAPRPLKRKTTQEVRVTTQSQCPRCKRRVKLDEVLSVAELEAWKNLADDRVSVALDQGLTKLASDTERRGWTDEMCGQCRDGDTGDYAPALAVANELAMLAPSWLGTGVVSAPLRLEDVLEQHAALVGRQQAIDDFDAVLTRFVARGNRPRPGSGADGNEA